MKGERKGHKGVLKSMSYQKYDLDIDTFKKSVGINKSQCGF